mmetsp:Transcript_21295/g.44853  ORF Transcript_21295/g.44853 Transcript_21295/m.44853 type:complete len:84 (-) Transcript_21295:335-586(-)
MSFDRIQWKNKRKSQRHLKRTTTQSTAKRLHRDAFPEITLAKQQACLQPASQPIHQQQQEHNFLRGDDFAEPEEQPIPIKSTG